MNIFKNFTECYLALAASVYDTPDFISSPRGHRVREKLAVKFSITDPRSRIPYVGVRKFSMHYMIAELLWYLSGKDSIEWIANYSSFWRNISDDGKTANSAYGARIFKKHPYIAGGSLVQWEYVIKELQDDPDSRRAIIHIRTAHDTVAAKLDVPCTIALQFFIRDGKLHQVVNMRSSDLILGIAYDVPAFTIIQEILANELGVELGTYTHVSNSLHIYEKHFGMVKEMLKDDNISQAAMQQISRGPMPRIPKQLPIYELCLFEAEIRKATQVEGIEGLIKELGCLDVDEMVFWLDWGKVLASHRLKKLGYKNESVEKLKSTSFVGYHPL